MVARLDATLTWAESDALWSSDETKSTAISSFKRAKEFYESALQRAR